MNSCRDIVLMSEPKFLSTSTKIMALLIWTIETAHIELLQKCRPARQLHFTSHPRHTSTRNFRACTRFLHFVTYIFIMLASARFPFSASRRPTLELWIDSKIFFTIITPAIARNWFRNAVAHVRSNAVWPRNIEKRFSRCNRAFAHWHWSHSCTYFKTVLQHVVYTYKPISILR